MPARRDEISGLVRRSLNTALAPVSLTLVVWLCLVKRKHDIVAALTIFGRLD
jgi:hypothetical protein